MLAASLYVIVFQLGTNFITCMCGHVSVYCLSQVIYIKMSLSMLNAEALIVLPAVLHQPFVQVLD